MGELSIRQLRQNILSSDKLMFSAAAAMYNQQIGRMPRPRRRALSRPAARSRPWWKLRRFVWWIFTFPAPPCIIMRNQGLNRKSRAGACVCVCPVLDSSIAACLGRRRWQLRPRKKKTTFICRVYWLDSQSDIQLAAFSQRHLDSCCTFHGLIFLWVYIFAGGWKFCPPNLPIRAKHSTVWPQFIFCNWRSVAWKAVASASAIESNDNQFVSSPRFITSTDPSLWYCSQKKTAFAVQNKWNLGPFDRRNGSDASLTIGWRSSS